MTLLTILSRSETWSDSTCDRPLMKKITYTYDSMNRRVARTDEKGTTYYLYGNPNHPFQLTAVRSPLGSLSRYHYDDFGLLFAIERDNNWYYITTDQLGTPRVVCDVNGEVVKVLEYDSFGQVIADRNPEFELHISFTGGLIDGETELVRFGFRDYDAVAGKWTAKDPIGFDGGDTNLYGYVVNDPVNLADSLGLEPESLSIVGVFSTPVVALSLSNELIYQAAINYRGSSTSAGPGGGSVACAWSVNNVLRDAGLAAIGNNPNLVDSVEADLRSGRGFLIENRSFALAGDLALVGSGQVAHIGICLDYGCQSILSNSSGKKSFSWVSNNDFHYPGSPYNGMPVRIYRVSK